MEHASVLLTLTQALHLVALAPCILVIFILLATTKNPTIIIAPVLFFVVLAIGLSAPLIPIFGSHLHFLQPLLGLYTLLLPAISYLLVLQCLIGAPARWYHWFILLVPILIGIPAIYTVMSDGILCVNAEACFESSTVLKFSNIIAGGLIMLLITAMFSRIAKQRGLTKPQAQTRYWLALALIALTVCIFMLELGSIATIIPDTRYMFANIMLKLAFIYLVLTTVFRVFTDAFDTKTTFSIAAHRQPLTESEKVIAKRVDTLMHEEKAYLEMGYNLKNMSMQLGMSTHALSRIINRRFEKNAKDYINSFRINEAKTLLLTTDFPITNIAFDTGFNSIASFNRVFKIAVGCSPTEYREAQGNV